MSAFRRVARTLLFLWEKRAWLGVKARACEWLGRCLKPPFLRLPGPCPCGLRPGPVTRQSPSPALSVLMVNPNVPPAPGGLRAPQAVDFVADGTG